MQRFDHAVCEAAHSYSQSFGCPPASSGRSRQRSLSSNGRVRSRRSTPDHFFVALGWELKNGLTKSPRPFDYNVPSLQRYISSTTDHAPLDRMVTIVTFQDPASGPSGRAWLLRRSGSSSTFTERRADLWLSLFRPSVNLYCSPFSKPRLREWRGRGARLRRHSALGSRAPNGDSWRCSRRASDPMP